MRQAALTERQLDTEVRKPADAHRYRVEQEAEGQKNAAIARAEASRQATIAAAQAEAEQARLTGEGERARRSALAEAEAAAAAERGEAEKRRREAVADAVEREGSAEASAILARGKAEAAALDEKARAFAEFGQAAVLDLVVRTLPELVRAGLRAAGGGGAHDRDLHGRRVVAGAGRREQPRPGPADRLGPHRAGPARPAGRRGGRRERLLPGGGASVRGRDGRTGAPGPDGRSGRATRPNGDCARTASPSGPSNTAAALSLATKPGARHPSTVRVRALLRGVPWLIPALCPGAGAGTGERKLKHTPSTRRTRL